MLMSMGLVNVELEVQTEYILYIGVNKAFSLLPLRVFYDIGDTNTILTIKNAQLSDAGKYEVFVENSLGTDQSFARVDVL